MKVRKLYIDRDKYVGSFFIVVVVIFSARKTVQVVDN